MYSTCPKCGHERQPGDAAATGRCPACGLLFAKWMKQRYRSEEASLEPQAVERAGSAASRLAGGLLAPLAAVESGVDPLVFWSRVACHAVLVVWGIAFILTDHTLVVGGVPDMDRVDFGLHTVNLVFHEAGHVLFIPFGQFMMVLGGTLGQLGMPLIVLIVFVWRHANPYGGAVALWWLGQSMMDVAVYVHDAKVGKLTLLGGMTGQDAPGRHDWSQLLAWMGELRNHASIASAVDLAGVLIMLTALVWGGWLLLMQYRER